MNFGLRPMLRGLRNGRLRDRVVALEAQCRDLTERAGAAEVHGARSAIGQMFLRGTGIEVGAGSRPFPLPPGARCFYGDVRDRAALASYFQTGDVTTDGVIDAQSMAGVPEASLDFVISAHVIEHLFDPVGAIRAAVRVLKDGGCFICVVPELTMTFDRARPPTELAHVLRDAEDGGESTRLQAYVEHVRYVHPTLTGVHFPDEQIEPEATKIMQAGMDLHVHAWRAEDFRALLARIAADTGVAVSAEVSVGNENIFVLRREG